MNDTALIVVMDKDHCTLTVGALRAGVITHQMKPENIDQYHDKILLVGELVFSSMGINVYAVSMIQFRIISAIMSAIE